MSKQRRVPRRETNNVYQLTEALAANGRAFDEGPKRKHWSIHDLKRIQPMTSNQEQLFHNFGDGYHVVAQGSAGTGKTFLACYLALRELLDENNKYEKIIIIRSAVPTRDAGFLPGTMEEKAAIYELPYIDIFADLLKRPNSYQDMKDAGKVEFVTTSYIRGLTWDNALIIFDECQSATFHEINSVVTRIGRNTRFLVAGDLPQNDLRKKGETTGLHEFLAVASHMKAFRITKFVWEDIVRSEFVKSWIKTCDTLNISA